MKKAKKMVLISATLLACAACVGLVLSSGFGGRSGNVFVLEERSSKVTSQLQDALRLTFPSNTVLDHVAMVGGKDWTLYVVFSIQQNNVSALLKSLQFPTRDIQVKDVQVESPALDWWKIAPSTMVQVAKRDTKSYTDLVVLKSSNDTRRVFMYTDGGPSGFAKGIWALFKK